jgi:hypothetical protein
VSKLATTAILIFILFTSAIIANNDPFIANNSPQGNMYKVIIHNKAESDQLAALNTLPVLRLNDGYMVIADDKAEAALINSGLDIDLVAKDISRDELALDNRMDRKNVGSFELLYEENQLRLFRIDPQQISQMEEPPQISRIPVKDIQITYPEPVTLKTSPGEMIDLDSLIGLCSKDSIQSYNEVIQTYINRQSLTPANRASRDWLFSKFVEFGYDSVVLDTFITMINSMSDTCHNVVAYKVGSLLPDHHIIVCAHRDAVPGSPGADDNGSGCAAVLEISRILKDVDTRCTIIFALFDGEELGLLGSTDYANEAAQDGDSILFVLNMDMIGYKENNSRANVFHGGDMTYANLWAGLADSLAALSTTFAGASANSDHYPFLQNGYNAIFVHEYVFSSVYHSYQDSTSYMNFKYMNRMVQASLVTAYVASQSYSPFALEFGYPDGIPEYLSPLGDETFRVTIEGITGGTIVPGSVLLHYSISGGPFATLPMEETSKGIFETTFPNMPCLASISYYVTAQETINGIFYDTDPSDSHHSIVVEEIATLFTDDFELDNGWTVYGDAQEGDWERGVPIGGGDRGDPPTDYDGSGSCYLTFNMDGNSDIDFGTTNLVSPTFDLSIGDGKISYARWYSNYLGYLQDDVMKVYISNDDGGSWALVEIIGPDGPECIGGWYEHSFWAGDFVEPTSQMKLRFEASDLGMASTVEAAVDAVTISTLICNYFACGDANADGNVNVSDAVYVINYVFTGGAEPQPMAAGDVNCDSLVNVSDAVYIINHIFVGGNSPCDTNGDSDPDC